MMMRCVRDLTAYALMLTCAGLPFAGACGGDRKSDTDASADSSDDDDDDVDDGSEGKGAPAKDAGIGGGSVDASSGSKRDASIDAGATKGDGGASADSGTTTTPNTLDAAREPAPSGPFEGEGEPWTAPAPRATCGANDKVDGKISGLSQDVRCNLELIGQVPAPLFITMAWYKDCAYINGTDGTTVIQVAPDGKPTVTTTLTELGFRASWESMKLSQESGLLVGYESNGTTLTTYDVKKDCAHPELASTMKLNGNSLLGGSIGHAGSFSPDGTIYYASSMYTSEVFAVDLANPKQPKVITLSFERGAHDLFVGKGGNRGYFANPDVTKSLGIGSVAVMDLSQVQARAPNAKGTLISELSWEDGSTSQYPILLNYCGKDYLFIDDELGSGNCDDPKKPVWGYGRIFDIADEKSLKLASLIKTEAHDPANCAAAVEAEGGAGFFGVSTHYCNVDRLNDPRLLSCGVQAGGVRVYDIRNPWRPKEVAYFNVDGEAVPGMQRIYEEKRELWMATQPGTFYVLKIAAGSPIDQILSQ